MQLNMEKILLTGGLGMVSTALIKELTQANYQVNVLTRNPDKIEFENKQVSFFEWNLEKKFIDLKAFEGISTIIHLAGANIGSDRWTEKRKKEILSSRVDSANLLFNTIRQHQLPIKNFISSSAVGYYGAFTSDKILTENDPNGSDFVAGVCQQWEAAAHQFETLGMRVIILRKGVIIGNGGMYQHISRLAKWGINTTLGNGKQWVPWIFIGDLVQLYLFSLSNKDVRGTFNAVSDEHVTMQKLSQELSRSFHRWRITPALPAFALKIILGEMAVMLLKGTRVSNQKIKEAGFRFEHTTILSAFQKLVDKK